MKLFYASASPFVRKVMVALHETGQIDAVEIIDVAVSPTGPVGAVHDSNPLGKIPCLVRDTGAALYDSRVICRYLDTLQDGAKLYPAGDALWEALTLEAMADGIMDAVVLMTYEGRLRPAAQQSSDWVVAQWGKACRALDNIEAERMGQLEGAPGMAGLAVAVALGYIDFRHGAREWRDGRPKLAAWETAMAKRESMAATAP